MFAYGSRRKRCFFGIYRAFGSIFTISMSAGQGRLLFMVSGGPELTARHVFGSSDKKLYISAQSDRAHAATPLTVCMQLSTSVALTPFQEAHIMLTAWINPSRFTSSVICTASAILPAYANAQAMMRTMRRRS